MSHRGTHSKTLSLITLPTYIPLTLLALAIHLYNFDIELSLFNIVLYKIIITTTTTITDFVGIVASAATHGNSDFGFK